MLCVCQCMDVSGSLGLSLSVSQGVRVAGVRPAQQVHMMGPVHAALRQQQGVVRGGR